MKKGRRKKERKEKERKKEMKKERIPKRQKDRKHGRGYPASAAPRILACRAPFEWLPTRVAPFAYLEAKWTREAIPSLVLFNIVGSQAANPSYLDRLVEWAGPEWGASVSLTYVQN